MVVKTKKSIHMMDIYDDRVKDVCEPKNDDSSTSTIVEEFESLVGEIIKQKEEVKEISDPAARRGTLLPNDESILKEEVHKETLKSYLNPLFEDDEEIISIEWKRILYGEDFEKMDSVSAKTKDFDKSSSNVFKSLSDELEPNGSSYVEGNGLDFHVGDVLFSPINEDKGKLFTTSIAWDFKM
ncbi:hypothetical protein Tco_0724466 [Tanacetum coccineum]